jgi:hypothetical protein
VISHPPNFRYGLLCLHAFLKQQWKHIASRVAVPACLPACLLAAACSLQSRYACLPTCPQSLYTQVSELGAAAAGSAAGGGVGNVGGSASEDGTGTGGGGSGVGGGCFHALPTSESNASAVAFEYTVDTQVCVRLSGEKGLTLEPLTVASAGGI